jgi:hypothetical protein
LAFWAGLPSIPRFKCSPEHRIRHLFFCALAQPASWLWQHYSNTSDGNVASSHRIWGTFQLEHYLADIVLMDGLLITHQIFLCYYCIERLTTTSPLRDAVVFFSLASEFGT